LVYVHILCNALHDRTAKQASYCFIMTVCLSVVIFNEVRFVHIHCVPEKKLAKMYCNIFYKISADSDKNLVHSILNKFATLLCKCFPPHLTSVSALPCEA